MLQSSLDNAKNFFGSSDGGVRRTNFQSKFLHPVYYTVGLVVYFFI